jgi:hypothetical protein
MAVVRRRVEEYFEHHLVERWIPKLLARLAEEARRLTVENQRLRLPMPPHPSVRGPAAQLSALLLATAQADSAGAVLDLVKGWTPATTEVIRGLLQMRAVPRNGAGAARLDGSVRAHGSVKRNRDDGGAAG